MVLVLEKVVAAVSPYVPTKRCSDLKKHEPHPWKEEKGAFKRQCPGRTTTKLPSRSRRAAQSRKGK